jgi:hypothetical protein
MEMVGEKFNMLTVIELDHIDARYIKYWKCLCECGRSTVIPASRIKSGHTKSCGCYGIKYRAALEMKANEERRLYTKKSYTAMINRCYNPKAPNYYRYGAKGVSICDRWRFGEGEKSGWLCFFEDMGTKPTSYTLDRIDNGSGYYKDNCRWASRKEQALNRKRTWKWSKNLKPADTPPS